MCGKRHMKNQRPTFLPSSLALLAAATIPFLPIFSGRHLPYVTQWTITIGGFAVVVLLCSVLQKSSPLSRSGNASIPRRGRGRSPHRRRLRADLQRWLSQWLWLPPFVNPPAPPIQIPRRLDAPRDPDSNDPPGR